MRHRPRPWDDFSSPVPSSTSRLVGRMLCGPAGRAVAHGIVVPPRTGRGVLRPVRGTTAGDLDQASSSGPAPPRHQHRLGHLRERLPRHPARKAPRHQTRHLPEAAPPHLLRHGGCLRGRRVRILGRKRSRSRRPFPGPRPPSHADQRGCSTEHGLQAAVTAGAAAGHGPLRRSGRSWTPASIDTPQPEATRQARPTHPVTDSHFAKWLKRMPLPGWSTGLSILPHTAPTSSARL